MSKLTMKLIAAQDAPAEDGGVLALANDIDPREASLAGIERVDLQFPKFADGRAFSQAFLLRRRLGFQGDIRATGEVLIDQLLQMQRTGFSSAVLRAGEDVVHAQQLFERYASFYQGDAVELQPGFKRNAA